MAMLHERSIDTDAVILVLRGINGEISYRDIAKRAGLAEARMKAVLGSARRILRNEGVLFGCVWGEGLRRLTDADIVMKPERFKRRVFRGAGREIKDLGLITNFGELSKVEQHSVTLNRTILGALRQSASVKPDKIMPTTTPKPMPDAVALIQMRKK